ncbi:hypothetical protein DC434_14835 [Microbacterium sp. TPD7012]|nr:hypothetical protein DC434_14835 [Microbacterium sp. TPD7012]
MPRLWPGVTSIWSRRRSPCRGRACWCSARATACACTPRSTSDGWRSAGCSTC